MRAHLSPTHEEAAPSLLMSMGLAPTPSGGEPAWLERAIYSLVQMWPLIVIVRLLQYLSLGIDLPASPLALTMLAVVVAVDLSIILWPRSGQFRTMPPHYQLRWFVPLVALSAGTYALLCSAMVGGAILREGLLLNAVGLPALVAVAIFGNQRVLAFVYCAASVAALGLYGVGQGLSLPLAGIATALIGLLLTTVVQAKADQANLQRGASNQMRGLQATQLLKDFEESGQGWFWETDRNGHLTYVSQTLARRIGVSPEALVGRAVTSLMQQDDALENEAGRSIGFHLSARSAFSELAVRAAVPGEDIWWSISGRPVVNEYGHFLGFRGSGSDLTERRRSQAEIARLASFDSLTGLANRAQMQMTLEQAMSDQKRHPVGCALFMLDLDRFKHVNDTMGHPAGDALLRQVSMRLRRVIGDAGKVGRLGGDEFQIVFPGLIDRPVLGNLAERIIQSVSQPYVIEETQVVIGVSVGIAIAPQDGAVVETLTRNADLALYKAKDHGRGVYRFYSQDMHAEAEDRRQLEQDLRHAINVGGLGVEYQPVVSSITERISGFEALVRWTHPARGPISPALFVPIAEEAGLIGQIGEWVLRTACQDARGWPSSVRVAVNVSPIQFRNHAFPTIVMSALANSGLDAERLELEITEGVFLQDGGDLDSTFAKLKGIGVRLALDDFGTGYSSLGYLKSAPFDKIKIDQSFVRGAAIKGSRNGAIVKSIVSLAEALSMETTAEGAETLDELELIRSLGCSHVQGYIYGRPAPNEDVLARFASGHDRAEPKGFKASRETRRTMLRSVRLIHGQDSYEARIRNISAGGVMVEGLADVPPGTRFRVAFTASYAVAAICRWSSHGRLGLEFLEPVVLDLARGIEERNAAAAAADAAHHYRQLKAG